MTDTTKFQVRPLYLQVRDALLERIKDGRWKPGANLPSEIDLYRELGVGLGTLRKALSVLENEQLIIREPGRGTFVRDHKAGGGTPTRFNPVRGADGAPIRGEVKNRKAKLALPTSVERAALRLDAGDQIVRIQRTRFHDQRRLAYEHVCLPDRCFPGLADRPEAPDEVEELAQEWGVLVARAEAKVKVVPAPPAAAAALSLAGQPHVLSFERLVFDTDEQPIEAMTAYFNLQDEFLSLDLR